MALVLNRMSTIQLKDAWEQVSSSPCVHASALLIGGPCAGTLMAIHTELPLADVEVMPGVYFSAEQDNLEELLRHPYRPALFFIGYAGWAAGQLEGEIDAEAWTTLKTHPRTVFDRSHDPWPRIQRLLTFQSLYPQLNINIVPKDPQQN